MIHSGLVKLEVLEDGTFTLSITDCEQVDMIEKIAGKSFRADRCVEPDPTENIPWDKHGCSVGPADFIALRRVF